MILCRTKITELDTERLRLRQWQAEDYPPFALINADPDVMAFYPACLTVAESDSLAQKIEALLKQKGWGFWAVELKNEGNFIGFVGLHEPQYELPFKPCIEIGWRLAKNYWGRGYATEAAQAALKFAFEKLRLDEVVSFTSLNNRRSEAVMQRLHMVNTGNNFEHPSIAVGHPLREHLLYKITKAQWKAALSL